MLLEGARSTEVADVDGSSAAGATCKGQFAVL